MWWKVIYEIDTLATALGDVPKRQLLTTISVIKIGVVRDFSFGDERSQGVNAHRAGRQYVASAKTFYDGYTKRLNFEASGDLDLRPRLTKYLSGHPPVPDATFHQI